MELGISTFVELTPDPRTGKTISAYQRIQNLMEEVELADQLGLDIFAIGEHHRPDFIVSSPAIVLAAAAVKTKQIKLSSAVTVLSSDDPVRVFQQFATVDLLSGGRAEIMAGRGTPAGGVLIDDIRIREFLLTHFNLDELKNLAFDMPGENHAGAQLRAV
jgi:alkanesulfonate monooxygenase SsuD/methylene tetrahydromethanopterin reductase-like flavin-dependent oxidoreductase (luciferase family)